MPFFAMRKTPALLRQLLSMVLLLTVAGCQGQRPETSVAASVVLPAKTEIPQFSLPLSVTQAYQAIPHQRTAFDTTFSKVPAEEKAYLELMFLVVDQAIAVRVSTLRAYNEGDRTEEGLTQYQALIDFVETVTPPESLSGYHNDIKLSLMAQKDFFQDWRSQSRGFAHRGNAVGNHPKVQVASTHLRSAYGTLMNQFPDEDSINKSAFFDYHCALDFI